MLSDTGCFVLQLRMVALAELFMRVLLLRLSLVPSWDIAPILVACKHPPDMWLLKVVLMPRELSTILDVRRCPFEMRSLKAMLVLPDFDSMMVACEHSPEVWPLQMVVVELLQNLLTEHWWGG
jgi:hypothetical protein